MKSHSNEIVKASPVKVHRTLEGLLTAVRACRACDSHLPLGPRPVLQAGARARILIVGQAPGAKVHASGDLPPRRECAELWLDRLLAKLPHIELTLLVGQYAQTHFLRGKGHASVTATTRDWRAHAPGVIALPHPSPRNVAWFMANPWFDDELLPVLRHSVHKLVAAS